MAVVRLDSQIEAIVNSAIQRTSTGSYINLDPQFIQDILAAIRATMSCHRAEMANVSILTKTEIRRYIRKLVELEFPSIPVVSRGDLEPEIEIKEIACVSLGSTSNDQTSIGRGTLA